jgi:hypothetical protein
VALFSESLKNQVSLLLLAISWQEIFIWIFVFAMFFFFSRSVSLFSSRSIDLRDLAKLEITQPVDKGIESLEKKNLKTPLPRT